MAAAVATKGPRLACYQTAWARRGWTQQLRWLVASLPPRALALRTTSRRPFSTALTLQSRLAPRKMVCPSTAMAAQQALSAIWVLRLHMAAGIGGGRLLAATSEEPRRLRSPLSRWLPVPLALPERRGRPRPVAAAVTATLPHLASAPRTSWAPTRHKGRLLLAIMLAYLRPLPLDSAVARPSVGRHCPPTWGAQVLAALPGCPWCQPPCRRRRRRRHLHWRFLDSGPTVGPVVKQPP